MAMIKCKECGNEVSSKAAQCPNCGVQIKKKGSGCGCLTLIVLVVVGKLVFDAVSGIAQLRDNNPDRRVEREKEAKQKAQESAAFRKSLQVVPAEVLISNYTANEIAADSKVKGKWLKVSGKVDAIGKDLLNTSYVTLKSGESTEFRSVQCFFAESQNARLAELRPGQEVVISGRCEGLMMNVLIKECELE